MPSGDGVQAALGTTITDDGGAYAIIPADAPVDGQTVAVGTLSSLAGLPPTGDPAAFSGGIVLEPHGAVFDTPVTIAIPLTQQQTPGRELRLYYWDGAGEAWQETDFFAVVGADGWTASGEVTHFSYYILQPSQIEAQLDGIFGDIEQIVTDVTFDGGDLATVTGAAFLDVVAHVNARFRLGDLLPMDLPVPNGYNCYTPVGLYIQFDHGGAPGIPRTLVEEIGDTKNVEFRIDYLRDVDVYVKEGDLENQLLGSLAVNTYWRSTPPSLALTSSRSKLWGGDSSSLTATLMCGDHAMKGQPVEFSLSAGTRSGSFDPGSDDTDGAGRAETVFTAGEAADKATVVEAYYQWSNQHGDVHLTLTGAAEIAVGALTGTWTVRGSETVSGCTELDDNGSYSGSAEVHFDQSGQTFIGWGNFPRESDMITGTVQRNGTTRFTVKGTSDYIEVDEQADRDDDSACAAHESCEEWKTYGVANFSGTGSIETQTIDFTWSGRDTEGDTCVFQGRGKATYTAP